MVDVEEQSLLVLAHQSSKIVFPFLKRFSFSGISQVSLNIFICVLKTKSESLLGLE